MFGSRNSHPTERADLFGTRLVVASESNLDAKLSEAVVKELTGGDRIKARRMREDFWEFSPSHTLLLVTNHQPQVVGTDHGIWRRLAVVPFTRTYWSRSRGECGPPELEMIPDLRDRLRAEHPGILRWLVAGCLAWQAQGLSPPTEVLAATQEYRTREDVLAEFLDAVCRYGEGLSVKASVVREAYQAWCTNSGERPVNGRVLWPELARRRVRRRTSNGTWYDGMALQ
jgi:putative DNA primase/helicase